MKRRISAIIHTLNEELNIANAIRSVAPWVDEIVVIDMYSDDRTAEIARSLGARVLLHEKTGFVEPARAYAEAQALGDWILFWMRMKSPRLNLAGNSEDCRERPGRHLLHSASELFWWISNVAHWMGAGPG